MTNPGMSALGRIATITLRTLFYASERTLTGHNRTLSLGKSFLPSTVISIQPPGIARSVCKVLLDRLLSLYPFSIIRKLCLL